METKKGMGYPRMGVSIKGMDGGGGVLLGAYQREGSKSKYKK
jgi:hypothetical protein